MHKFVSFNRRLISAENSRLSAVSSAALYGKGVFTTIAIYNHEPFQWEKHWQRLSADAEKTGVNLSDLPERIIETALAEIIAENNVASGRARITLFDESAGRIWQAKLKTETSFTIQTVDFRPVSNNLQLTVSPFPINSKSPLAGVKSCNYLENILALENAQANGFDEAIRLNERGEIVSATAANVFWTKSGEIFTPSLKTGCLAGTTRSLIAENLPVVETKTRLNEIIEADEVFLTSAGIGIVKVESIDSKGFSAATPKINELKLFFRRLTQK
jgi:branched-subunit amino acid aminotransferase/4-amino-4-deoxychorismate lyase